MRLVLTLLSLPVVHYGKFQALVLPSPLLEQVPVLALLLLPPALRQISPDSVLIPPPLALDSQVRVPIVLLALAGHCHLAVRFQALLQFLPACHLLAPVPALYITANS